MTKDKTVVCYSLVKGKLKKFKVPVSWQMYGHVTVEADTLQHAAEIAESDMGIGLPDNGEYVEGSWEVDYQFDTKGELIDFIQKHRLED